MERWGDGQGNGADAGLKLSLQQGWQQGLAKNTNQQTSNRKCKTDGGAGSLRGTTTHHIRYQRDGHVEREGLAEGGPGHFHNTL